MWMLKVSPFLALPQPYLHQIGMGSNCIVNSAFEGCVKTGVEEVTAQVIANFAMGGNVSILQGIIDLF